MVFVHAPSSVEVLSLCFLSPNGLWFKMQTDQQVAITVACSCEMMLVRSVRFFWVFVMFFFLFKCSIIMSVAIYPYMPHSKRPNISETGLQSVSSTVDRTFTMQNLKIVQTRCEFTVEQSKKHLIWPTARMLYMPVSKVDIKCMEVFKCTSSKLFDCFFKSCYFWKFVTCKSTKLNRAARVTENESQGTKLIILFQYQHYQTPAFIPPSIEFVQWAANVISVHTLGVSSDVAPCRT